MGLICALQNGCSRNLPGPPIAMSNISIIGSTELATVKLVPTGLIVPLNNAYAVLISSSVISSTSVATQQRVNQLTFVR